MLDNALRYGGPHIVLRASAAPGGLVRIEIEDNGPGVPPEDLPRLIEPSGAASAPTCAEAGGSDGLASQLPTRSSPAWVVIGS